MMLSTLWILSGCFGGESPSESLAPSVEVSAEHVGVHEGVQHPPIPADSPAWAHDPGGFVPDFRFYGERSWDDVRMRVAGHIGVIERDRARLAASGGDLGTAAWIYESLASEMDRLLSRMEGQSREIPLMIRDAAQRDAQVLRNQGQKQNDASSKSVEDLPNIAAFKDFDDRHKMRLSLWSLYLAAADPVHPDTAWGYFDRISYRSMLDQRAAVAAGNCQEWILSLIHI